MKPMTLEYATERLELADQLYFGRPTMLQPQDLPGRFGRVIKAVDHLLQVTQIESVLAGGWAVWRHGYDGRLTQDVDIVLPADRIEEFMRAASVSGFDVLPQQPGRWPKLRHKDTRIKVDILPEGARPGTPDQLAPTTIRHPKNMGASQGTLRYIELACLVELKIAAGRDRDRTDVIEIMRTNWDLVQPVREHLASIHSDYAQTFDELTERARKQVDH